MNPIPLVDPSGRVYAYACSVCHHVAGGSSVLYTPDEPGPIPILVSSSERSATTCCTCHMCGVRSPRGWNTVWCAPCRWWMSFGSVWYCIGAGHNGKVCPVCHSAESDYCRKTPKCIDCDEGHGGNNGRCRECALDYEVSK